MHSIPYPTTTSKTPVLKPRVCVVICTYNGSNHIAMQILSILNQTYKNLEILVCDDCSTDNTMEIVKLLASENTLIRYHQNSKNRGFNKNFEQALRLANSEFIAISDQDDIWNPLKIEELMDNIGDNWLIFSNSSYIDENNILTGDKLLDSSFKLKHISYKNFLMGNFVTGHTVLINRDFLNFCLPFPPIGFYDWWMGFVAAYHQRITYLDRVLTYYRLHAQSVIQKQISDSAKTNEQEDMLNFRVVIKQLKSFQKYKHLDKKDKNFILTFRRAYISKRKKNSFSLFMILLLEAEKIVPYINLKRYKLRILFDLSKKIR